MHIFQLCYRSNSDATKCRAVYKFKYRGECHSTVNDCVGKIHCIKGRDRAVILIILSYTFIYLLIRVVFFKTSICNQNSSNSTIDKTTPTLVSLSHSFAESFGLPRRPSINNSMIGEWGREKTQSGRKRNESKRLSTTTHLFHLPLLSFKEQNEEPLLRNTLDDDHCR